MAGIYIPGMEIPNKKNGAVLIIYPDGKCAFENGKTYQAVPVPPHGRLIDADAMCDGLALYNPVVIYAECMTTIIPAREEGE